MAEVGRGSGLRTIFSFFLAFMVTAFVGVGVHTFYGPPEAFETEIRQLERRERAITAARAPDELTAADREQIQEITDRRDALRDEATAARSRWARGTSIILIAFATLAMAVSLIRAEQLPVVSNGLLLGGVFTMLYGVGWVVATDRSVIRFVVMTVALVVTLALGYVRFIRQRGAPAGSPSASVEGLAQLERRVGDLESRMNEAAAALGARRDAAS